MLSNDISTLKKDINTKELKNTYIYFENGYWIKFKDNKGGLYWFNHIIQIYKDINSLLTDILKNKGVYTYNLKNEKKLNEFIGYEIQRELKGSIII